MKVNKFIWWLAAVSVLLVGCGREPDARLLRAEAMMEERPDSALALLDSIDSHTLRSDADRALFAVLYTQAQDKNYLTPTDDSLITEACRYYEKRGDKSRLALASYYQGSVRYNNKNLPMAMPSYFKALDLADETGDSFRASMACRGISDIYCDSYNRAEELHYARKEYDYMAQCGRQPYLNYAMADYARALGNNLKKDSAIIISKQLIDSAKVHGDSYLHYLATKTIAIISISQEDALTAAKYYKYICHSGFADSTDSLYYYLALVELGDNDRSAQIEALKTKNELLYNLIKYKAYKNTGNYKESLTRMENLFNATNKSFENAISHNLTSTLSDNYTIQHKHDIEKIENTQTVTLLISILAVSILTILLLLFKSVYQRQKNIIKEKIVFAEQLAESLKSNNDSTVLREIMEGQYTLLDNLVKQFSLNVSPSNYGNTMSHAITSLINNLYVSDGKFKKMEMNVDKTFNNLFSDFKHDLPNLKEADYRIFLFSVLKLSAPTMALLLGEEKLTAVYERKRRLKDKIGRLNESKRDKYKSFI